MANCNVNIVILKRTKIETIFVVIIFTEFNRGDLSLNIFRSNVRVQQLKLITWEYS